MTNRADELLRDLIAAWDEDRGMVCAVMAARAYLNEKPHEPQGGCSGSIVSVGQEGKPGRMPASPHAAAEPERPMNERCEHGVRWEHPCRACDNPNRGPSRDAAAEPVGQPMHTQRWNIEESDDGSIRICRGVHASADQCLWEHFVPKFAAPAAPPPIALSQDVVRDALRYRLFRKIIYVDRDESFDAYDAEQMDAELDKRLTTDVAMREIFEQARGAALKSAEG